jgi:hypothetical protein
MPDDNLSLNKGDNSKVLRRQDFVIGTDSKPLLLFLQVSFVNIHLFFKLMNFVCIFFRLLIYTLAYFMMLTRVGLFAGHHIFCRASGRKRQKWQKWQKWQKRGESGRN